MGYTHYYTQKRSFTDSEWHNIRQAADIILRPAKDVIDQRKGSDQKLWINKDSIRFNGIGPDDDHETFYLPKQKPSFDWVRREGKWVKQSLLNDKFHCCKTARKPYDKYVTALLIVIHNFANGALDIASDGFYEEWIPGKEFASKCCFKGEGSDYLAIPIKERRKERA
jgi:hypothetical protein